MLIGKECESKVTTSPPLGPTRYCGESPTLMTLANKVNLIILSIPTKNIILLATALERKQLQLLLLRHNYFNFESDGKLQLLTRIMAALTPRPKWHVYREDAVKEVLG